MNYIKRERERHNLIVCVCEMVKFCMEVVEFGMPVFACSLQNYEVKSLLSYLLTEGFIVLHVAAKNGIDKNLFLNMNQNSKKGFTMSIQQFSTYVCS